MPPPLCPRGRPPEWKCSRAIAWQPDGAGVAVGLNTGRVLVLDGETLETKCQFHNRKQWIQVLKFDPSGDFLAVGSHAGMIDIFRRADPDDLGSYALHSTCQGHSSFITHIDWTADGMNLRSNCGAYELLFWEADSGQQLPGGASALRDAEWVGATCVLGWDVTGIWPPGAMGCQINAVARSHDLDVLATCDNFGKINLFQYPCPTAGAECQSFKGHSSHVSNIEFSFDDSTVVSVGGNDDCCLVWEYR